MRRCISCGLDITNTAHDLCAECRDVLRSVFRAYYADPEVKRRWHKLMVLIKEKGFFDADADDNVRNAVLELESENQEGNSIIGNYRRAVNVPLKNGEKTVIERYRDATDPGRR